MWCKMKLGFLHKQNGLMNLKKVTPNLKKNNEFIKKLLELLEELYLLLIFLKKIHALKMKHLNLTSFL